MKELSPKQQKIWDIELRFVQSNGKTIEPITITIGALFDLYGKDLGYTRPKPKEVCKTCNGTTTIPTDKSDFDMCPDCNKPKGEVGEYEKGELRVLIKDLYVEEKKLFDEPKDANWKYAQDCLKILIVDRLAQALSNSKENPITPKMFKDTSHKSTDIVKELRELREERDVEIDEGELKDFLHDKIRVLNAQYKRTGEFSFEIRRNPIDFINELVKDIRSTFGTRKIELPEEELPKKFNGADLCAVREDFGWWVGYDCTDLKQEISATGKTLNEAFIKLNDYWFKSGRAIQLQDKR